jgi:hypothetical protein
MYVLLNTEACLDRCIPFCVLVYTVIHYFLRLILTECLIMLCSLFKINSDKSKGLYGYCLYTYIFSLDISIMQVLLICFEKTSNCTSRDLQTLT